MTDSSAKVRLARLASRQFGRVTWTQLKYLGISNGTLSTWCEHGYIHPVLPRVYAVGHSARSIESDLMAAVLYAGPGAMLSHATAAWWVALVTSRPYYTHVSTPRQVRSLPGIKVHSRRYLDRVWHNGLPVTRFEQTLLDYAAQSSLTNVRLALARADYEGTLHVEAIAAVCKPGRPGSAKLRTALERHLPALADTRSRVEAVFLELCQQHHLPLPEVNARIAGWDVDFVWREQRLVVEIDGPRNHRTHAQTRRDRRKDMDLRGIAFLPLRYSDEQVLDQGPSVMEEVCATYRERDRR